MMSKETIEEVAERLQKDKYGIFISKDADVKGKLVIDTAKAAFLSGMIEGIKYQQDRSYSEEDMSKSYFIGWITRERYDDLSPDIIYPSGLDYEEQQNYAFNLWFDQFKKEITL